jgi:hypothetical protein
VVFAVPITPITIAKRENLIANTTIAVLLKCKAPFHAHLHVALIDTS